MGTTSVHTPILDPSRLPTSIRPLVVIVTIIIIIIVIVMGVVITAVLLSVTKSRRSLSIHESCIVINPTTRGASQRLPTAQSTVAPLTPTFNPLSFPPSSLHCDHHSTWWTTVPPSLPPPSSTAPAQLSGLVLFKSFASPRCQPALRIVCRVLCCSVYYCECVIRWCGLL